MYNYRYINKYVLNNKTHYTLILEDFEEIMPTVRIDMKFSVDSNQIDSNFLYVEAKKCIVLYLQKYKDSLNTESE